MSPFFTLPAEHTKLAMHDDTHTDMTVPSGRYFQIARTLLAFLMCGTRPSMMMSKSRLDLIRTLGTRIVAFALAQSPYSESLIVQLTQFLGAIRNTRRIRRDRFLESSFRQLAPIIVSHCTVCFANLIIFSRRTYQPCSVCDQRLQYPWV